MTEILVDNYISAFLLESESHICSFSEINVITAL